MYFLLILALLVAAALLSHASKQRMRDCIANIKGPFCVPWVGSIEMIINSTPQNFLPKGQEYVRKFGPVWRVWAFNRLNVISSDVKMNEQILASQQHIVKHRNYKILHQWLGTGLLMSDGKKWHSRRKIITPTFHFKILEEFVEVFDQQSTIFVERLGEKADGKTTFNVYPYVCLAALDVIAETAMGTKIHAQTDSSQYATAVNEMTKLMAWRFVKVHLNSEIVFTLLYPHLKLRQMKLISNMQKFTMKVIEERRQVLQQSLSEKANQQAAKEDELTGVKKRMAFLDVLLQATVDGKSLSNDDIREEVDTFMFEGHDTTTSAISFALHLLSRHPTAQNKLLKEAQEVLGTDPAAPVSARQLNELKYTEWAIKETLRLYPSVPVIGRQIEQEFKYTNTSVGDGVLPPGTEYLIAIYAMMRDERIFENVEDFIPERHENPATAMNFSMIPFSAGPRNCVGQKFAMLEMKMLLAKVVRAYELLPLGEAVKPELNIVLRSSNGFQLGLKRRT